jgi:hypothetical protein
MNVWAHSMDWIRPLEMCGNSGEIVERLIMSIRLDWYWRLHLLFNSRPRNCSGSC